MTKAALTVLTIALAMTGVAVAHETGAAHEHNNAAPVMLAVVAMLGAIGWRMWARVKDRKTRAED